MTDQQLAYEILLSDSVQVGVECRCGETHFCTRPLTAAEKRQRNRKMVEFAQHADTYFAADPNNDAWQYRTLNLDGMVAAGRI